MSDLDRTDMEFMHNILTPDEQLELERTRNGVNAEAIIGLAGLMSTLGIEPTSIMPAIGEFRGLIAAIPLNTIRTISSDIGRIHGHLVNVQLPTREVMLADAIIVPEKTERTDPSSTTEQEAIPAVVVINHAHDTPTDNVAESKDPLAIASEDLLHTDESQDSDTSPSGLSVQRDTDTTLLQPDAFVDVDETPALLVEKTIEEPVVIARSQDRAKRNSPKGIKELSKLFNNILSDDQIIGLQQLDTDQTQIFLQEIQTAYTAHSTKPTFGPLQVNRIALYMQGYDVRTTAGLLDQSPDAVNQSLYTVPKILERSADTILAAYLKLQEKSKLATEDTVTSHESVEIVVKPVRSPEESESIVDDEISPSSELSVEMQRAQLLYLLKLDSDKDAALQDLLDPASRLPLSDVQANIADSLREYIIENYDDVNAETLDLTSGERMVLRKLTGLFFNQRHQVDPRKPQKISDQVRNASENPQIARDLARNFSTGLAKLIAHGSESAIEPKSTGSLVVAAATSPESVSPELWLRAAKETVNQLAEDLGMDDDLKSALWDRSHKDGTGNYLIMSPIVKTALERVQDCMVRFSTEFSDKSKVENKAILMFLITAFGSPKNLDEIDEVLFKADNNEYSLAERNIVLMFQKMIRCLEHEKSRAA